MLGMEALIVVGRVAIGDVELGLVIVPIKPWRTVGTLFCRNRPI